MSTRLTYTFGQNNGIDSTTGEILVASLPTDAASVKIRAKAGNTGLIYVGLTGVTASTGFELSAGDTWVSIGDYKNRIDASAIFVIASVDEEDVCYEIAEYNA